MDWKHYQTDDPLQKEPQVGRGLFGIRLLILHFKFQFSKSIKSSTFHIFLNLTYLLRKKKSLSQNTQTPRNLTHLGPETQRPRDPTTHLPRGPKILSPITPKTLKTWPETQTQKPNDPPRDPETQKPSDPLTQRPQDHKSHEP